MRIIAASAPLRRSPQADAPLETEALFGESVTVYDEQRRVGLGAARARPVCRLSARPRRSARRRRRPIGSRHCARTPIPGPAIKLPPRMALSLGAQLEDRGPRGRFRGLGGRALSLVAPSGGAQRARTGLCRGRRALSRNALSLGRPDVRGHRLLGPGPDGADRRRRRFAARQRHAGGGVRRASRASTTRTRRLRAAISYSGRARRDHARFRRPCFTPTAGT